MKLTRPQECHRTNPNLLQPRYYYGPIVTSGVGRRAAVVLLVAAERIGGWRLLHARLSSMPQTWREAPGSCVEYLDASHSTGRGNMQRRRLRLRRQTSCAQILCTAIAWSWPQPSHGPIATCTGSSGSMSSVHSAMKRTRSTCGWASCSPS